MPTVLEIQDLVQFLRETESAFVRAGTLAQVATMKRAEVEARKNAKQQFTGRNDRRISGRLSNSIYSGLEKRGSGEIPTGFIGVRDIPYAAIHEFGSAGLPGGVIKPKPGNKMQRLWIPNRKASGRMTPRDFIKLKQGNPSQYFLNDKVAGRWLNKKTKRLTPLFFLVKQVTAPERPYLRPAMEVAIEAYPDHFERFLKAEVDRG